MEKSFNIYFADRQFNITGMASTAVPFSLQIISDKEVEIIEEDTTMLDISVNYSKDTDIDSIINVGYYILYQDENGKSRYFTIIESEKFSSENLIELYAEDAGLDLLNTVALPYKADKAYPISHYIQKFAGNSGFVIGINELEGYSRQLEWTGEDTATKRILSVCTQFDHAELEYSFEIKGLTVVGKYINIYKKRGRDTGITLRLYEELNEITTSKSIEKLATGLYVTGGTPEGQDEQPITLAGYKYDDGRFYTDGPYLLDRYSFSIWNRFGIPTESSTVDKHIISTFSFDTLSQSELFNRAMSELKKLCEVEVNFTVDIAVLPEEVRIGDTVNIVDLQGQLFLNARILQFEKSRTSKKNEAILGEFLIKSSGIHQKVSLLAEKIASLTEIDATSAWIRFADDDKGNGMSAVPAGKSYIAIKTVLNQPVPSDDPADYEGLWVKFVGDDAADKFTWIKYADTVSGTGMSDKSDGKAYIGFAFNKDSQTASNNPMDYQWFLAKGSDGKPGKDGENGKTTYFYVAWADSADGTVGFTISSSNSGNKGYMGTYSSQSATQSKSPSDYAWIKLAGAFEETIKQLQADISGVTKVVTQPDQPQNPQPNMQWWRTEVGTDNITGYFIWNGSSWESQTIQQSLLNIVRLNAVEINGSVISGSSFLNYWDRVATNGREGIMRIEDGILRSNYTTLSGYGHLYLDDAGIKAEDFDSTGKSIAGYGLNQSGVGVYSHDAISGKEKSAYLSSEGLRLQGDGRWAYLTPDMLNRLTTTVYRNMDWAYQNNNTVTLIRNGNTVILHGYWRLRATVTFNNTIMAESIPNGFRPTGQTVFLRLISKQNAKVVDLKIRPKETLSYEGPGAIIVENNVTIPAGEDFWLNYSWMTVDDFPY